MTTVRRWLWIVFLALVGAFEFVLMLPIALVYSNRIWIPPWYAPWFVLTASCALSLALLRLVMDPIRIYATQLRYAFKYPPLWVAVVGALVLAAMTETLPLDVRLVRRGFAGRNELLRRLIDSFQEERMKPCRPFEAAGGTVSNTSPDEGKRRRHKSSVSSGHRATRTCQKIARHDGIDRL